MSRIDWYDDNTLVIRTKHVLDFMTFFNAFGLIFTREQHDNGPWHYTCQVGDKVLEIYPT